MTVVGTQLGPYEVLGRLGAGGMGEVYRARDPRLGRDVAIKVLPQVYSQDPERLRRFEQEARAAGMLNHPNIVSIFDVGRHDGSLFVVAELLEGETLRAKMREGALPARKAVDYGLQIARGLAAAHEHGIVHRDLKPENIFVTRDGRVKILDFGLAKLKETPAPQGSQSELPTIPPDTVPGMVLGTVGYMSPEQVRGMAVDHRSDLFSLGAIVYEMAAGRRAFLADTSADLMTAILREDPPPLSQAGKNLPPALERIVDHCLEKNREERFQSARDVAFDLESLSGLSATGAALPAISGQRRRPAWGLAMVAVVVALGLGFFLGRQAASVPQAAPARVHRLTEFVGLEETPAISPDGRSVAFTADQSGSRQIWVRLVGGGPPLQITRDSGDHERPRWAPDSNSLIYYVPPRESGGQGAIWEISALGGAPRRIGAAISGGDISHDGARLALLQFSRGQVELVIAARDGSNPRAIARLSPGYNYQFPRWSPDDKWIAYQQGKVFLYDVFVVSADGGQPQRLTHDGNLLSGFTWLPDGSGIVYSSARGGTLLYLPPLHLWAVQRDGSHLRQLTFGEDSYVTPDLNAKGTLVASLVRRQFNIWKIPVGGSPQENVRRAIQVTHQTGAVQTPSVSPDNREVVYLSDNGGHGNLWVMNLASNELRQITFEQDPNIAIGVPVWSPDGKNIAFVSTRNRERWDFGLWLVSPDGSNLRNIAERGGWAAWSSDGRWLYYAVDRNGNFEIYKVLADGAQRVLVRNDNSLNPVPTLDGSLYHLTLLADVNGLADYEVRLARPENGPARFVDRIASARAPGESPTPHLIPSPDGKWLALQLHDGPSTNIWVLPASGPPMRQITDFSPRRTVIARRISWSSDSRFIFAAVGEADADVVRLEGLLR